MQVGSFSGLSSPRPRQACSLTEILFEQVQYPKRGCYFRTVSSRSENHCNRASLSWRHTSSARCCASGPKAAAIAKPRRELLRLPDLAAWLTTACIVSICYRNAALLLSHDGAPRLVAPFLTIANLLSGPSSAARCIARFTRAPNAQDASRRMDHRSREPNDSQVVRPVPAPLYRR
jgi:hypothetical protein